MSSSNLLSAPSARAGNAARSPSAKSSGRSERKKAKSGKSKSSKSEDKTAPYRVALRVSGHGDAWRSGKYLQLDEKESSVQLVDPETGGLCKFDYPHMFGPQASNQEVYEEFVAPTVRDVVAGYNGTVFAYGPTGSGKSHTMLGSWGAQCGKQARAHDGVLSQAAEDLLNQCEEYSEEGKKAMYCDVSFLYVHDEEVYDLLNPDAFNDEGGGAGQKGVLVHRVPKLGVRVDECLAPIFQSMEEFNACLRRALIVFALRKECSGWTEGSGHLVTRIQVYNCKGLVDDQAVEMDQGMKPSNTDEFASLSGDPVMNEDRSSVSTLYLVELAGNERTFPTVKFKSLLAHGCELTKGINRVDVLLRRLPVMPEKKRKTVIKSSQLTFLLSEAFGGNCKVALLGCVLPLASENTLSLAEQYQRTLSTLIRVAECTKITTEPRRKPQLGFYQTLRSSLRMVVQNLRDDKRRLGSRMVRSAAEESELRQVTRLLECTVLMLKEVGLTQQEKRTRRAIQLARHPLPGWACSDFQEGPDAIESGGEELEWKMEERADGNAVQTMRALVKHPYLQLVSADPVCRNRVYVPLVEGRTLLSGFNATAYAEIMQADATGTSKKKKKKKKGRDLDDDVLGGRSAVALAERLGMTTSMYASPTLDNNGPEREVILFGLGMLEEHCAVENNVDDSGEVALVVAKAGAPVLVNGVRVKPEADQSSLNPDDLVAGRRVLRHNDRVLVGSFLHFVYKEPGNGQSPAAHTLFSDPSEDQTDGVNNLRFHQDEITKHQQQQNQEGKSSASSEQQQSIEKDMAALRTQLLEADTELAASRVKLREDHARDAREAGMSHEEAKDKLMEEALNFEEDSSERIAKEEEVEKLDDTYAEATKEREEALQEAVGKLEDEHDDKVRNLRTRLATLGSKKDALTAGSETALNAQMVRVMPMIRVANMICIAMDQPVRFAVSLERTSSKYGGQAKATDGGLTDIYISGTCFEDGSATVWSLDFFRMKLEQMHRAWYSTHVHAKELSMPEDPEQFAFFLNPVGATLIGEVSVYLNALSYLFAMHQRFPIICSNGSAIGELEAKVYVSPLDAQKSPQDGETSFTNEEQLKELVNAPVKFTLEIIKAVGIPETFSRRVFCQTRWPRPGSEDGGSESKEQGERAEEDEEEAEGGGEDAEVIRSPLVEGPNTNPFFGFKHVVKYEKLPRDFVDFVASGAPLVIDVLGECPEKQMSTRTKQRERQANGLLSPMPTAGGGGEVSNSSFDFVSPTEAKTSGAVTGAGASVHAVGVSTAAEWEKLASLFGVKGMGQEWAGSKKDIARLILKAEALVLRQRRFQKENAVLTHRLSQGGKPLDLSPRDMEEVRIAKEALDDEKKIVQRKIESILNREKALERIVARVGSSDGGDTSGMAGEFNAVMLQQKLDEARALKKETRGNRKEIEKLRRQLTESETKVKQLERVADSSSTGEGASLEARDKMRAKNEEIRELKRALRLAKEELDKPKPSKGCVVM